MIGIIVMAKEKVLFGRSAIRSGVDPSPNTEAMSLMESLGTIQPCPFVTFGPKQNNLKISLTCYTDAAAADSRWNDS